MSTPTAAAPNSRRGLARWSVAAVATAALVVSGSGLVVFAQGGEAESQGPVFVPAEAPVYIEARLDMPAGQHESVAQMMTAFPGFADAGSFDMKVAELMGGLAAQMNVDMPDGDLIGDVLTGEIGLAITDFESAMMTGEDPGLLLGIAVADPAAADAIVEELVLSGGSAVEVEPYGDELIVSDPEMSIVVTDSWMVLSPEVEQVKTSIDVLAGTTPSLADDPGFLSAFSRVPAAHLGAAYVNLGTFGSMVELAGMMAASQSGMDLPMQDLGAMLPQDMVMYLAAEADRMNLEVFITPGEQTLSVPVGESDLAGLFPAETQVYVETRELGAAVETGLNGLVELMTDDGTGATGQSEIDMLFGEESPITSMLGVPLPEFLDVVGDAAMGSGWTPDGLWIGMAAELTDEAEATDRLDSVVSLLRLFGGDPAETGIAVSTELVGDVEVRTITLPLDELTAGELIPDLGDSIDVAVADGSLLMGTGDFVERALTEEMVYSLGANAAYTDALAGDVPNSGVMYVNISSMLSTLDPLLAMMAPEWADIAPYATGLDRMIAVGTEDDGVMSARMTVIVNQ